MVPHLQVLDFFQNLRRIMKSYFYRSWFAFPSFRRKIFFFQVISIDNSCLLPKTPVPDQQQYLISTDRVMLMGQPVLSMIKETD